MELTKLYLYQFFFFCYQHILHTLYVTLQLGFKHWIMKIIGDIFIHLTDLCFSIFLKKFLCTLEPFNLSG